MRFNRKITVVGAHAEGEVGRVVTGGVLPPPGDSLFEQQQYLWQHDDGFRKFLLYEPRGGAFTHANLIVPAKDPRAEAGFIIMEPDDYPPMSGSNSICVSTVLLETGMIKMKEPETKMILETPGGLVHVVATCRDGRCERVKVTNVPCFATHLDQPLEVDGLGTLTVDVAYGGAFFLIIDAAQLGFALERDEARRLVETGELIKAAAQEQIAVAHPDFPEVNKIVFTEFTLPVSLEDGVKVGRNTVCISPGKLDRSPCGTGTSARLAVLHAKGEIGEGDAFVSRSVIGTEFHTCIESTTRVGDHAAIVPSIAGRAWITGFHDYVLDPEDPFPQGYTLSDTWYRALD
jgi:proline racemase